MRSLILTVILVIAAGCTSLENVPARIYDLKTGKVSIVNLSNFIDGHGLIKGELDTGEKIKGEYILNAYSGMPQWYIRQGNNFVGIDTASSVPGKDERTWSEVYGYGEGANAKPVGSATMIGDSGTVLNVVFYKVSRWDGIADGVARSNKGEWYRIHVGKIEDKIE